jgi:hypothetical protein
VSCRGEVNAEEIEIWVRAGSFPKVNEFIANPESPMDLRIVAVEKYVEYGRTGDLQTAIEDASDKASLVEACRQALLDKMESEADEAVQREAKQGLFGILGYLQPEQKDDVIKRIADWAFKGLTADTSQAALKAHIEKLRMNGQLSRMGVYGVPVASYLVSYGLETQRLSTYLVETATTPELQRVAIAGIAKLFALDGLILPWHVLDNARLIPLPETFALLVDVYLNPAFDNEKRESALQSASELLHGKSPFEKKAIPSIIDTAEKRQIVMASLDKLMGSKRAADRWDAFEMIYYAGGVDSLDRAISGIKNDIKSYFRPTIPATADYVIIDMCREKFRPKKEAIRPLLEGWLSKGDRVQKGFALLCLKVLGDPASKEKITPLLEQKTKSLERLFYFGNPDKPYKIRKAMLAEQPTRTLTIARLAQNVMDGIDYIQKLNTEKTAGSLPEEDFKIREELVLGILDYSGDRLTEAVDKMYYAKTGKTPPTPNETTKGAGNDGKKTKRKNRKKRKRK